MTTSDQPRPRSAWFAHHYIPIASVYCAALAVHYMWPGNMIVLAVELGALAALWAALMALNRHEAILCPRCAAEFPLDGAEQAQRRLWWLYYAHFYKPKLRLLFLALIVSGFWWRWSNIVLWVALIFDHHGLKVHDKLQLWCPWCRHRRGDDDITIVPPVPTGTGSRTS